MALKIEVPEPGRPEGLPLNEIGFQVLVESVRDYAIYMLDPGGVVVSWNAGAERIKGYRAEEIIGRSFRAFYLPEDVASGRPELELETAAGAGRFEEEWWRLRKDGSRFRAHVTVTALRTSSGRLAGFAKVIQDVTERWQAEQALRQSEERFRVLVEQISDYAIFLLDSRGRVTTWNAGAGRIKGYTRAEVLGRSIAMFYTPEDVASGKLASLLRRAEIDGRAHDIGWRVRKDGSRFWADVTLTALRDGGGKLYGFAKVVRDLTERIEAEEQARAYEAAREAISQRDEFLSIAAHELRTPVTASMLQLQGLQMHLAREPEHWQPERLRTGIDMAARSSKRLSELAETLLDVSRIASGRIQLRLGEFDLGQVAREGVERLEAVIRQSGSRITEHIEPGIVGCWDRLRLEQALMNLISNACKYAPGSDIEVRVGRAGERVRVSVSDTGPGISSENLERIFGRFERAVPASNYGGLGLGLYVTRQIAEAHGGEVTVKSLKGEGSTFTIELPLRTKEAGSGDYQPLGPGGQVRPPDP